jgi:hypothetical protein
MRLAVLFLIAVAGLQPQELAHTTEPRVAHTVKPEYTKQGLDAKIEGDVILTLMIGADGTPSDIKLVRGLGKGLDEKASNACSDGGSSPLRITVNQFPQLRP